MKELVKPLYSEQPLSPNGKKRYASPYINKDKNKGDGLIRGATVLSIGGLIAKLLGAFYRIPLTSLLGAEGLGIYQTAFPVYCILLTFSSTGVPSAIAKLISGGFGERAVLKKSLSLFIPIGILGSLIMVVFAPLIANLQGNVSATLSYIALAPSVALVSVISCIRGYFQGKLNMVPTALSQIIEQAVKLIAGLSLCYLIKGEPFVKGALACLAVTVSEIACLIFLFLTYKRRKNPSVGTLYLPIKRLIATLLPIILSTLLIPLSRFFDSFTIVNILNDYTPFASSLYGIYTGSVESVVGVPVAICYGISSACLPQISKAVHSGNIKALKNNFIKAFSFTLFLSTAFGLGLFIFSDLIVKILFGGLTPFEQSLTARLLSISFFAVIGLSLIQTFTACLVGLSKPLVPCLFLSIGIAVKFSLQLFLLKNPNINIFGALYSDIACYFVAVFLNLLYIRSILFKKSVQ